MSNFLVGRYDLPAPWLKEPSITETTATRWLNENAEVAFARVEWLHRDCEERGVCIGTKE